jgi:hypothetical protein
MKLLGQNWLDASVRTCPGVAVVCRGDTGSGAAPDAECRAAGPGRPVRRGHAGSLRRPGTQRGQLISPFAARAGLSTARLIYACLAAVTAAAALAWLAGTVAQNAGMWVLPPFAMVLALAQLAVWRPITGRISQDERDQHLG